MKRHGEQGMEPSTRIFSVRRSAIPRRRAGQFLPHSLVLPLHYGVGPIPRHPCMRAARENFAQESSVERSESTPRSGLGPEPNHQLAVLVVDMSVYPVAEVRSYLGDLAMSQLKPVAMHRDFRQQCAVLRRMRIHPGIACRPHQFLLESKMLIGEIDEGLKSIEWIAIGTTSAGVHEALNYGLGQHKHAFVLAVDLHIAKPDLLIPVKSGLRRDSRSSLPAPEYHGIFAEMIIESMGNSTTIACNRPNRPVRIEFSVTREIAVAGAFRLPGICRNTR
jgi:hypothetical protein